MHIKTKFYVACLVCFLLIILGVACDKTSQEEPATQPLSGEEPAVTPILEPTSTETKDPMLYMFVQHTIETNFDRVSCLFAYDIDSDGDQDVIGAAFDDHEVAWWRNEGGEPLAWTKFVIDDSLESVLYIHVEDIDGDSDGDVVAGAGTEIFWWRNDGGDPVLWTRILVAENLSESQGARFADLDDDGDFDVLGSSAAQNRLFWAENVSPDGGGLDWVEHTISDDFTYVQSVFTADMDGDGDLDVLGTALTSCDVAWWSNDGGTPINWTMHLIDDDFSYAHWVFVIDMDQDGRPDVLGAAYRGENQDSSVAWWPNEGGDSPTFTKYVIAASFKGALTVHAADLDLDGDIDVLGTSNDLSQVAWWRNDGGDPIVWTKYLIQTSFSGAWPITAADFDNDGDIDIVAGADRANDIFWWENTLLDK